MKKKFYYVKYESFRGALVEAKCERSALFQVGLDRVFKDAKLERIVEIDEKIYLRLDNIRKIRKQKEYEEWVKSGGREKVASTLGAFMALSKTLDSRGYYDYKFKKIK